MKRTSVGTSGHGVLGIKEQHSLAARAAHLASTSISASRAGRITCPSMAGVCTGKVLVSTLTGSRIGSLRGFSTTRKVVLAAQGCQLLHCRIRVTGERAWRMRCTLEIGERCITRLEREPAEPSNGRPLVLCGLPVTHDQTDSQRVGEADRSELLCVLTQPLQVPTVQCSAYQWPGNRMGLAPSCHERMFASVSRALRRALKAAAPANAVAAHARCDLYRPFAGSAMCSRAISSSQGRIPARSGSRWIVPSSNTRSVPPSMSCTATISPRLRFHGTSQRVSPSSGLSGSRQPLISHRDSPQLGSPDWRSLVDRGPVHAGILMEWDKHTHDLTGLRAGLLASP
jgi:hypothetical protein